MKIKNSNSIFYVFRKSKGLSREQISDQTMIPLKRWIALETWEPGVKSPTIEEIILIDRIFETYFFRKYFAKTLIEGEELEMPRRVEQSSDLMIYMSLSKPIIFLNDVAIALSCSTPKAGEAMEVLIDYAKNELNMRIPPSGGIQTIVFEKCYGLNKDMFKNSPEVVRYLNERNYEYAN